MKRNFAQVRQWLEANFPELKGKITGGNFAPPPLVELMLKLVSGVQLVGMAFALLGTNVFSILGMQHVPSWYDTLRKNGVQIAIFLYLLLPQFLSSYMVSGAFEIMLDGDQLIFSKLATGRLPQFADILNPLIKAGLKQAVQQ
jgi:selT/selW/selH-like putative selenoprotein